MRSATQDPAEWDRDTAASRLQSKGLLPAGKRSKRLVYIANPLLPAEHLRNSKNSMTNESISIISNQLALDTLLPAANHFKIIKNPTCNHLPQPVHLRHVHGDVRGQNHFADVVHHSLVLRPRQRMQDIALCRLKYGISVRI